MKVALKLFLCYLVASYLAGILLLLIDPPHAHIPTLVVWAMSPLLLFRFAQDLIWEGIRFDQAVFFAAFVLVFSITAYWVTSPKEGLQ
jgi:predicted permease